jgi:hypothetical protein
MPAQKGSATRHVDRVPGCTYRTASVLLFVAIDQLLQVGRHPRQFVG